MTKFRLLIFLLTVVVVGALAVFASYYARGYRFDIVTLKFVPNGLFVANSDPNGASIFVDGELKTATNATIPLGPGSYDVSIRKEGFLQWSKRLTIEKEIVTQVNAVLFPSAASLSPITFSGAISPVLSPDSSKIAYSVPHGPENGEKSGLWVIEMTNLPIGFSRDPRRITDGDLPSATWEWSPDSREIVLTTKTGTYLLDATTFTPQSQRVNLGITKAEVYKDWEEEREKMLDGQMAKLPDELESIFTRRASNVQFSPDENKIMYVASGSANIPTGLVRELPGSSTQKQVRDIKEGKKYIYDTKEDRNFEIGDATQVTYWFPTSEHVIVPENDKIIIMDYDGTNRQTVYSGSYAAPYALPYTDSSKILLLTNLGSGAATSNIYSLNLR